MKILKYIVVPATLTLALATAGPLPKGQHLSLALEEVPIAAVLNMIATQNGLNLVVSGQVTGNVTMRLDSVDVATALDAILTASGYTYFLRDNVIIVKTAETEAPGELESRVITLKYIEPVTAKKALAAIKSTKGKITILDRTVEGEEADEFYHPNRIIITDYPNVLDDLLAVITQIDVRERSIMIEAKIIETTIDSKSNLGIAWPTAMIASLSDAEQSANTSGTTTTVGTTVESKSGTYNPNNGTWTWGKLSVGEVNWILNMLEQDGNSRLVSDPRITTLENHQAEFKFKTVIPIQTISRFTEGAATSDIVTFQDIEVGISLKVTARINEGGTITMDVEPTVEDIISFTGPPDNQKPITASRSIRTRVTVQSGETVALGGLLKESEIERVQRVPILGHIPLLGRLLFSFKSTETTSTDLLILITPRILD